MIGYRDMTFCASRVHGPNCNRQLTPEVLAAAEKWWGGDDYPIAVAYFCEDEDRMCPVDEHDLMCGCGDSYPHGYDGSHIGIVYGCCACHASGEDLAKQYKESRAA